MDTQYGIEDVVLFLRRRKKTLLGCFFGFTLIAIVVALALPPKYQASVRILRESQQVSEDYVRSTITSYAEERFNALSQQILVYSKLSEIIDQYNLYPDERNTREMGHLVSKMRKAIKLDSEYESVINENTGRNISISSAYLLSFEGKDPLKVQQVANKLASMFIEEDEKTREKSASTTTRFFEEELERLKKKIRLQENHISRFKEKHVGELPENYEMNIRVFDRLERELDRQESRMRTLEERQLFLKAQIVTVDPLLPIRTEEGKTVANPSERLKQLRLKLMTLQSKLSEKHPDIVRMKAEIRDLENQVTQSEDVVTKMKHLEALEGQLAQQKGSKGPKHPDVIKTEKEIALIKEELENLNVALYRQKVEQEQPDNPTYIHLQTQIFNVEADMKNAREDKDKINQLMEDYQRKVVGTPQIEKEYRELTRDYDATRKKYSDISNKLMEARVAQGMDDTERGERFMISEAAGMPLEPHKPNRLAIILLGVMAGLMLGIGLAALQEGMDTTIKSVEELSRVEGIDVFATVTLIKTDGEIRKEKVTKIIWGGGIIGFIIFSLLAINLLIMPLDQLWAVIIQRLAGI